AIREAEGDKTAQIERAEGDKQSAILRADGQRQAIEIILQAGNERLQPKDVISYLVALEYIETLPDIAKNGERVFLPYEASALLSSVGSIGDLLGKMPLAVK